MRRIARASSSGTATARREPGRILRGDMRARTERGGVVRLLRELALWPARRAGGRGSRRSRVPTRLPRARGLLVMDIVVPPDCRGRGGGPEHPTARVHAHVPILPIHRADGLLGAGRPDSPVA
jgi:hypothetical protein